MFTSLSNAQETLLDGKITNSTDVEGIHIINQTSRFNTITNQKGEFTIKVNLRDTLLISSVNYLPKIEIVNDQHIHDGFITIEMDELVNELAEVRLGNQLTGNIHTDVAAIKTTDPINFDDVGIPGFKGEPEEKIPNLIGGAITPLSVDVEALYKHITGYYKKLKLQRKWNKQNNAVIAIMNFYGPQFFEEAYEIPEERLYDFLLFCVETSPMQKDFTRENFMGVLTTFSDNSKVYLQRLQESKKEE